VRVLVVVRDGRRREEAAEVTNIVYDIEVKCPFYESDFEASGNCRSFYKRIVFISGAARVTAGGEVVLDRALGIPRVLGLPRF
jgi:hypothetical protein